MTDSTSPPGARPGSDPGGADPTHIVIIGATSAMATHCARLWVMRASVALTLVGRDADRLGRLAMDLRVRNPAARITTHATDLNDPSGIATTVSGLAAQQAIDIALIAQGMLPTQEQCQQDLALANATLVVNGVAPALWAEACAAAMAPRGRGTVALIGSVAGDRGRKSNYVYGAAKGLVTRYAQGLQHRFANSGVKVVLVKPGPTDTPMTAEFKARGARLAAVEDVAQGIVAAIERGTSMVYLPGRWRLIMMIIRHLPARIFNRLDI